MKTHIFKISFLIFWLLVLSFWWHDNRLYQVKQTNKTSILAEFENFYTIHIADKQIGWSVKSLRHKLNDSSESLLYSADNIIGYQYEEKTTANITVLNNTYPIEVNITGIYDLNFNLQNFLLAFSLQPINASVIGQKTNNTLKINANVDYLINKELVLENVTGPVLSSILPVYLSQANLQVGKNYTLQILSPLKQRLSQADIYVEELKSQFDRRNIKHKPIYKLRINFENSTSYLWVDLNGQVFKEENALKMSLRQSPSEEAAKENFELLETSPFSNLDNNAINKLLNEQLIDPNRLDELLTPLEELNKQ